MSLKKTNTEKELHGTAKRTKTKQPKAEVLKRIPKPAFELTPAAKKIFRSVCKLMITEEVATSLDVFAITNFAFWYERFTDATTKLMAEGMVQEYKSGASNVSGYLTATEKSDTKVQQYMKVLGLTPKHREMINAFNEAGQEEQQDKWVTLFEIANGNTN